MVFVLANLIVANFRESKSFQYLDGFPLICFPVNVDDARTRVGRLLSELDASIRS